MVTGTDLKNFAEEHGLLIPPYRDFDEWAKLINEKGGQCPCNPAKMCPCPDAITEIANAPTNDIACCTCRFYCDERYIAHWEASWRAQGLIAKKELPREKRIVKNEEVQSIIETWTKVKTKLEKDDPSTAMEILQNGMENHCEACQMVMDAEASRLLFLIKENMIDVPAYEKDRKRALQRIDELILLYEQVDESLDLDSVEHPIKHKQPEGDYGSDYHRCMGEVLKHPTIIAEVPSKKRFKVAAVFCAKKAETLPDAIEMVNRGD